MKLMIVGSRSISEFDIDKHVPNGVSLIITGGASGIDALAEEYADKNRISKLVLRPQYKLYGKNAPLVRNKQMVDACDSALIVWDGNSKGTKSTLSYIKKTGKEYVLIIK